MTSLWAASFEQTSHFKSTFKIFYSHVCCCEVADFCHEDKSKYLPFYTIWCHFLKPKWRLIFLKLIRIRWKIKTGLFLNHFMVQIQCVWFAGRRTDGLTDWNPWPAQWTSDLLSNTDSSYQTNLIKILQCAEFNLLTLIFQCQIILSKKDLVVLCIQNIKVIACQTFSKKFKKWSHRCF